MKDVTGLLVIALTLLMGRAGGITPNNGYCIGTQCYMVYRDSTDYNTAQDQCTQLSGHLMTVRSTITHDMLSILLGNFTGRFWIGLRLMAECPDAAAKLKGFQWVTKDTDSDWTNWAPGFDSSCSSHRCISVSKEDNFEWVQESCDERAAGFLCEYSFSEPCKPLVVAAGESVNYATPWEFGGEDLLSLPPGSIATRMPAETTYICFSEEWRQAPWSCEVREGGCEHKCAEDPKREPSCYCPPGQAVNPDNKVTCEVDRGDPCLALSCAHACYKNGDSYACTCDHGFKLAQDGRSCVDFNDCTDERQCPGENFKCINTVGGFQCVCEAGYKLTDGLCVDVCASAPCEHRCVKTADGYQCVCDAGFKPANGGKCVDVNECASAPCEHKCTNTPGSYKCSCYPGYKKDPAAPNKCKLYCGKEECPAECDPNNRFQCFCPDGYISEERGDTKVCIDYNECDSNFCDHECKNTFGSYVCSCRRGFILVGEYQCVEDEGSGGEATFPTIVSASPMPHPGPTKRPSGVSTGGLVGIIVCTVFFILLLVCLAHHILNGRGKTESAGALKAAEDETHSLHNVKSDT